LAARITLAISAEFTNQEARVDAVTGEHHGRLGCQQPENDRS
jgi:hypothetical protein